MALADEGVKEKLTDLLVTTWIPLSCLEAAHLTLPQGADPVAGVSLYRNCIVLKHILISGEIIDAHEWARSGRWTLSVCDGSGEVVRVVHESSIPLSALACKGNFCMARGNMIFRKNIGKPELAAEFIELTEPNWFPTAMEMYSYTRSISAEILQPAALLTAPKMTQTRARAEMTIRDSTLALPSEIIPVLAARRLIAELKTFSC